LSTHQMIEHKSLKISRGMKER